MTLTTVQTSLFIPSDKLTFLDISLAPGFVQEQSTLIFNLQYGKGIDQLVDALRSFVVIWPLIAICSIRVKNGSEPFKPEYIVPQLLLQWIRQSDSFDGICYFSSKVSEYGLRNVSLYRNYAFPVKQRKSSGYCGELKQKFHVITDAVPWQLFQLYKGSQHANPNEERPHVQVELIKGAGVPYSHTDFGRLETFLVSAIHN